MSLLQTRLTIVRPRRSNQREEVDNPRFRIPAIDNNCKRTRRFGATATLDT